MNRNPFDHKQFTGDNYKLKPKVIKALVITISILSVLILGRQGLAQSKVRYNIYNIKENPIDNPTSTLVYGINSTSDFYFDNQTPFDVIVSFNISDAKIENPDRLIEANKMLFITLRIYDVNATGKYNISYEVEAQ